MFAHLDLLLFVVPTFENPRSRVRRMASQLRGLIKPLSNVASSFTDALGNFAKAPADTPCALLDRLGERILGPDACPPAY